MAKDSTKKDRILIVDDEQLNRLLLEGMLEILGYDSVAAANGKEALDGLGPDIDLVLLDVNMPGIDGFQVAQEIRAGGSCADVPIIMVTALSSMHDRLAAVEAGANDFISKPVEQTELRIRVASQLRVKHAQDTIKQHHSELEEKVGERTASLVEANAKLARLATTDALTDLANHRALVGALDHEIQRCRDIDSVCSVLFIDIDHFKALNDACGHAAGDAVLNEFGQILREVIGDQGVFGRWGGEEFVVLLRDYNSAVAATVAEEFRRHVAQHSFIWGAGYHLTCSIGIATYPENGVTRADIASAADQAMYVAKKLGRNQVRTADEVAAGFLELQYGPNSREDVALEGLVSALSSLIAARDQYTAQHGDEVGCLAVQLGYAMRLNPGQINQVRLVGKLHDIGKVAIPDAILQKPGSLNEEEWDRMHQHPIIGAEVVKRVPSLRALAPAIRAHHERWDGSGYPDGLIGESIPMASRIVAVADAYSAMTSDRPYREAYSQERAIKELRAGSGTQFAPDVIDAFDTALARLKAA